MLVADRSVPGSRSSRECITQEAAISAPTSASTTAIQQPGTREWPWLLVLLGIITGVMGGMLGIGGGVVVIPLLVWIVRIDQRSAQGTSLALAVILVIANLFNYWNQTPRLLYWDLNAVIFSVCMAAGGMVGAQLSSGWALKLPLDKLTKVFSLIMLFAAFWMIRGGLIQAAEGAHAPILPDTPLTLLAGLEFLGTGTIAGIASGFTGIGGNVVMVPVLTELLHIDQKYAQGYAVGAMFPIVFTGAVKYLQQKAGKISTVLWLAPGSVGGVYLGGLLLKSLSSPHLKLTFGAFLVTVALWQLISGGPKKAATAPVEGAA